MDLSKIPFSRSRRIPPGATIFEISGHIGRTQDGIIPPEIGEQTKIAIEGVFAAAEEGGAKAADIVSTEVFMTDLQRGYETMNAAYAEAFRNRGVTVFPARKVIGANELPFGANIEIAARAAYRK